jgi:hypothetical protein
MSSLKADRLEGEYIDPSNVPEPAKLGRCGIVGIAKIVGRADRSDDLFPSKGPPLGARGCAPPALCADESRTGPVPPASGGARSARAHRNRGHSPIRGINTDRSSYAPLLRHVATKRLGHSALQMSAIHSDTDQ